MSTIDMLRTFFELVAVLSVLWAVFHEDKFIAFEEKLLCFVKRRKLKIAKKEDSALSFQNQL